MSRLDELQVLLDHLSNETNLLHQASLRRKIQKMYKEQANRVEELEEEINDYKTINKGLHDRRRKCKKQNNRYKQALEFYANIRNYHSELWENTAIEDDCGRIARQILADNHD